MLEALCSLRVSEDGVAREGDIIVLALPGHPWGTQELKRFIVVKWDDPQIEAVLLGRQKEFTWPIIGVPYATMVRSTGRMKLRSAKGVDVATITRLPSADVKDPTLTKPVLDAADYSIRAEATLVSAVVDAITSPFVALWNWMWS